MRRWLVGSGFAGLALAVLSSPIPSAASDYTAIKDPQFEQALIDRGIDSEGLLDGQILTTDIASAPTIAAEEAGVWDLTGLEAARSIKSLLLFGNNVTALDLANNPVLATLEAGANQLHGILDLSGKPDLISVDVTNNPNLLCVQVDDASAANAGAGQYQGWSIDPTTVYSQNCSDLFSQSQSVCGNGIQEPLEVCDIYDSGPSCAALGLGTQTQPLSCNSSCTGWDTSSCQ